MKHIGGDKRVRYHQRFYTYVVNDDCSNNHAPAESVDQVDRVIML